MNKRKIEATVIVNENEFRLIRYESSSYGPGEYYLSLWHMHPEREKKQGLISDGRKCMDCDVIAPEVINGFVVDILGYVDTEWEKARQREYDKERIIREGWSDEKKAADLEARAIRKKKVQSMTMDEWKEWMKDRKEQGKEFEI